MRTVLVILLLVAMGVILTRPTILEGWKVYQMVELCKNDEGVDHYVDSIYYTDPYVVCRNSTQWTITNIE